MVVSLPMPTSLKRDCITNFDMLFLVMGFISLVDEIQFMLISSRHICIRSIQTAGTDFLFVCLPYTLGSIYSPLTKLPYIIRWLRPREGLGLHPGTIPPQEAR